MTISADRKPRDPLQEAGLKGGGKDSCEDTLRSFRRILRSLRCRRNCSRRLYVTAKESGY